MYMDPELAWRAALVESEGRCRRDNPEGWDPEMFHPPGGPETKRYQEAVLAAKVVCWGCPVRQTCYELVLGYDAGIAYRKNGTLVMALMANGVWGGTDREERLAVYEKQEARSA